MRGPIDSPFAEGLYHGKILLPTDYPFQPPHIMFLTPNGRWKVDTKVRYHDLLSRCASPLQVFIQRAGSQHGVSEQRSWVFKPSWCLGKMNQVLDRFQNPTKNEKL